MTGTRRLRILARLAGDGVAGSGTHRLCAVAAEATGMTGAGIMLMSGDVPRGSVCTSDDVSAVLEQLQDALGEGPCVDAHNEGRPVLEPDLADPSEMRWPAFSAPAIAAGAAAVFGFPLRIGAVRLGALNLYRDRIGRLTDDQHADALAMADVTGPAVLALQSGAAPGQLAAQLEDGSDFQYVVHQAAGMVAAQLGVSVGKALLHLRAHAFGNERPLVEVATAVVDRTLRFDPEGHHQAEDDGHG